MFTGVSYELCDPPQGPNSLVGYSIRLESNVSRNTRLAFVTNGIALRMLETGSGQGSQGTGLDDVTVRMCLYLFFHTLTICGAHRCGRGKSLIVHT